MKWKALIIFLSPFQLYTVLFNSETLMSHLSISCLFYHFSYSFRPWRRESQPIAVFLPRESHGRRSLVDYIQSMGSQSWTWLSDYTYLHSCRKAISLIGILFLSASNRITQKSALIKEFTIFHNKKIKNRQIRVYAAA